MPLGNKRKKVPKKDHAEEFRMAVRIDDLDEDDLVDDEILPDDEDEEPDKDGISAVDQKEVSGDPVDSFLNKEENLKDSMDASSDEEEFPDLNRETEDFPEDYDPELKTEEEIESELPDPDVFFDDEEEEGISNRSKTRKSGAKKTLSVKKAKYSSKRREEYPEDEEQFSDSSICFHYAGNKVTGVLSFLFWLIALVSPLIVSFWIGDIGVNDFSSAFCLFSFIAGFAVIGCSAICAGRTARTMETAGMAAVLTDLRNGMILSLVPGILAAGILFGGEHYFTDLVMKSPFSLFALRAMILPLILIFPASVLFGFFLGIRDERTAWTAEMILLLCQTAGGLFFCWYLTCFGRRVGDVLGNTEHYASAYGARGFALGILIGVLAVLIYLVLMLVRFLHKEGMLRGDVFTSAVTISSITGMLKEAAPVFMTVILYLGVLLADQGLFKHIALLQGYTEQDVNTIWGVYFGRFLYFMLLPVLGSVIPCMFAIRRYNVASDGNGYPMAKRLIHLLVKFSCALTIPCAIGFALLAKPMYTVLFPGDPENASLSAMITWFGSTFSIWISIALITSMFLIAVGHKLRTVYCTLITFILHTIILALLMLFLRIHIYAVLISELFFAIMLMALNLKEAARCMGYHISLRESVPAPWLASVVMGILSFGVYYILFVLSENMILSYIFAAGIGAIVYFAFYFLFHGMSKEELCAFPGGSVCAFLAEKVNLL